MSNVKTNKKQKACVNMSLTTKQTQSIHRNYNISRMNYELSLKNVKTKERAMSVNICSKLRNKRAELIAKQQIIMSEQR